MKSVTYSSEQARLNWRDLLDAALSGVKVTIERYGKPTVVMVSHEKYEELERRAALSDPPSVIKARNDAEGTWSSQAEIDALFGPLTELRQIVDDEGEWNEIIERAERRAGVNGTGSGEKAKFFAEIEKELEALRQKAF